MKSEELAKNFSNYVWISLKKIINLDRLGIEFLKKKEKLSGLEANEKWEKIRKLVIRQLKNKIIRCDRKGFFQISAFLIGTSVH